MSFFTFIAFTSTSASIGGGPVFASMAFTSTSTSNGGGPVGDARDFARRSPYSRGNVLQRSLRHGGRRQYVVHGHGHSVQPAVLEVGRNVPLERQMTDFVVHHQMCVQPLGNENIRKGNLSSLRCTRSSRTETVL